ncbi:SH3 domain-containing protein [Streptomyces violascens]|uniref:hypothetical protein n=1 Tax=Streptomyces violascens TaxID=67381 RepID=UPI0036B5F3DD
MYAAAQHLGDLHQGGDDPLPGDSPVHRPWGPYRGHTFTVHKTSGNWHYITDTATGVTGWVSGTYVYKAVPMCLD